jgi:hypothetical protein
MAVQCDTRLEDSSVPMRSLRRVSAEIDKAVHVLYSSVVV